MMETVLGIIVLVVILFLIYLAGGVANFLLWCLGILGLVLLIIFIKFLVKKHQDRKWKKRWAQEAAEINEYRSNCIKQAEEKRRELFNRYLISGKEILTNLGVSRSHAPYEIIVYLDRIDAIFDNMQRSFSLREHRFAEFERAFVSASSDDRTFETYDFKMQTTVFPQVIFANALNQILGDIYDLYDMAQASTAQAGSEFIKYYRADHVILRLKATRRL